MKRVTPSCSFCHQPKDKVQKLIAGNAAVYICDPCIVLCYKVLREEGVNLKLSRWTANTPAFLKLGHYPSLCRLAKTGHQWEFTIMKTLTVDDQKRIRIPNAKPRQIFAYTANPDGIITLVPVKSERKEMFPRGSLLKYFTPKKDKEEAILLSGCVQGPE